MKRTIVFLMTIIFFSLVSSSIAGLWGQGVDFSDHNDKRTFSTFDYHPQESEGGLSGYWPYSFTIGWNITYNLDAWTYEYTLSASRKDISHFILELTEGMTQDEFTDIYINGTSSVFGNEIEGPSYWGQNKSNPGYPYSDDIYGIKFDEGGQVVTYNFTTKSDPVWGNFYAKSGQDKGQTVYAYNNALGIEGFNSDNKLDFIVRPNGGSNPPVIPEPISYVLFIIGGSIMVLRRFLGKSTCQ